MDKTKAKYLYRKDVTDTVKDISFRFTFIFTRQQWVVFFLPYTCYIYTTIKTNGEILKTVHILAYYESVIATN